MVTGPRRAEALDGLVPVRRLVRERIDPQVPGLDVMRVDSVAPAPVTDPVHDLIGLPGDREGRVLSEALGQVADALPPAVDEAAIASGRPTAADVLLEHDDPRIRVPLTDEV